MIPENVRELNVRFRVGRISPFEPHDEDAVELSVEDDASGLTIGVIRMSATSFAEALFSREARGYMNLYGSESYGKKHEAKTVTIPGITYDNFNELANRLWQYELDGWKADKPGNHNYRKQYAEGYQVVFRRYV